jgi:hypothetical protein
VIDFTEIKNREDWELFASDFFQLEGFFMETAPDRGPDGGKDFLMSETIKGKVGQYKFTWLVSCKHNAVSTKAGSKMFWSGAVRNLKKRSGSRHPNSSNASLTATRSQK